MNRFILTLCLSVLTIPFFTLEVMGQPQGNLKCIITDSGEYTTTAPIASTTSAPGSPSGTVDNLNADTLKFTTRSNKIVARLGVQFGFKCTVSGLPASATINLRDVYSYPAIQKPDGTVSRGLENSSSRKTSPEGVLTVFIGYGFDQPFELVTGKWRFEVWYGDQKLAEQEYNVVKAP